MNEPLFEVPPRLEWHSGRPFAFAMLPLSYAQELTRLALQYEHQITALPVSPGWDKKAAENPTGSRYARYNVFLLDGAYHHLYFALLVTYRFLVESIGAERHNTALQSWFNVHRQGQRLGRHLHTARFIGSFAAHAEGSHTLYGPSVLSDALDYPVPNRDGQLLVTVGRNHYHEVTEWKDPASERVSYAFDINEVSEKSANHQWIPFDSPWAK